MPAKKDILELPTRRAIFDHIRVVPGAHLRGIERQVALPFGQVLYHLDYLEKHGLIVSRKDGGFKRYFVRNLVGRQEKAYIAVFRHEVPRKVGVLLLLRPGLTHRELSGRVEVTGSTLSFHLAKMIDSGILRRDSRGNEHRYCVVDERTAARTLVFYRESWNDATVDRFADLWLAMTFRPHDEREEAAREDSALVQRLRALVDSAAEEAPAAARPAPAPRATLRPVDDSSSVVPS